MRRGELELYIGKYGEGAREGRRRVSGFNYRLESLGDCPQVL